jgi:hypothetical protein
LKKQLKLSEKERMPLGYFLGELTDDINEHSFAATYPGDYGKEEGARAFFSSKLQVESSKLSQSSFIICIKVCVNNLDSLLCSGANYYQFCLLIAIRFFVGGS